MHGYIAALAFFAKAVFEIPRGLLQLGSSQEAG